jgi:hypothetical protein
MKTGMSTTPPKAKPPLELLISCHQQHLRDTRSNLCEQRFTAGVVVLYTAEILRGDKNV